MKKLLITTLILLMIIPLINAQTQYLRAGIDESPTYNQNGDGLWSGRTPTAYIKTGTYNNYFPLVGNTDQDTDKEIIVINADKLQILNYTSGVGMILEQELTHGTTKIGTTTYYPTPNLFNTNEDSDQEIVSWNGTHFLYYSYNTTELILNQSAEITCINQSTNPTISNKYPAIRCSQGSQVASGNDTCYMEVNTRSGATSYMITISYDIQSNIARCSNEIAIPNGNADNNYHGTALYDGDLDGFKEIYQSEMDNPNGDQYIYKTETGTDGTLTKSLLYTHLEGSSGRYTDIIVTALNGYTPSISYGYTSDGTNYDARTIRASDGANITTNYCSVLTCPEGDMISANMWVDNSGTYSLYAGDVCYYIRNYEESDPGINIDTVHCISEYAGSNRKENELANAIYNFTNRPIIHQAELLAAGTETLLTPRFMSTVDEIQALPNYYSTDVCIPVDYQLNGLLDFICQNATTLVYEDDSYQNTNYEITGLTWDTGNSVCQNEIVGFLVTVTDAEEDPGTCYYTEMYGNYTEIVNSTNSSITSSQFSNYEADEQLNYLSDTVGTFILRFNCADDYHKAVDTYDYTIVVSNDTTTCHHKGINPGSVALAPSITLACSYDSDCPDDYTCNDAGTCEAVKPVSDSATDALSDIGILGTGGKAFFWLLIMVGVAFLILTTYKGEGVVYIIAFLEVVMLVMGWVLGMIGTVPLVIIGLFAAVLLTFMWMKGNPGGA